MEKSDPFSDFVLVLSTLAPPHVTRNQLVCLLATILHSYADDADEEDIEMLLGEVADLVSIGDEVLQLATADSPSRAVN